MMFPLVLAATVFVAALPANSFLLNPQIEIRKAYQFFPTWRSQPDAAAHCQSLGGKLANITTDCQLDEIREAIVGTAVENYPHLTEMWVDGTSASPPHALIPSLDADRPGGCCVILSNWNLQPNQDTGHKYNMYAKYCHVGRRYLCEFENY